jgi:hypothetical protein
MTSRVMDTLTDHVHKMMKFELNDVTQAGHVSYTENNNR